MAAKSNCSPGDWNCAAADAETRYGSCEGERRWRWHRPDADASQGKTIADKCRSDESRHVLLAEGMISRTNHLSDYTIGGQQVSWKETSVALTYTLRVL